MSGWVAWGDAQSEGAEFASLRGGLIRQTGLGNASRLIVPVGWGLGEGDTDKSY